MKRDMDLARAILLKIEADQKGRTSATIEIDGFESHAVADHVELLKGAGFLDAPSSTIGSMTLRQGLGITWEGYEFLESMRDPEVWSKTKAGAKKVGNWSISLLAELGKAYVKEKAVKLGLPLA